MSRSLRPLVWILVVLVLGYLGLVLWAAANEARFIYFPDRHVDLPPPSLALHQKQIIFPSTDGVRLTAWVIPAPAQRPSDLWLLIFHGNAGNISTPGRPEHDRQLRDLGLNLVAMEYRGYGESEGVPSEAGLYADATAAYQYLRQQMGVPARKIVLYGHSLGSAVAVDLASRVECAGLMLEGAFSSAPDLGREAYPWLPIRWIVRSRFASIDKIGRVQVPKLIIHGRDDQTIPIAHGRRLFGAAPDPKTFLEVGGGHDDAFLEGEPAYSEGMARFLDGLR